MQERYLATIDLGSQKIGLCVAKETCGDIQILYYKEFPSAGVRYSCVTNPMKAGNAVRQALDDAEKELSIKILQVFVGLPRYNIHQEIASAKLDCDENLCITADDIALVKEEAIGSYPINDNENEIIYEAVTQSYSTDDLFHQSEDEVIGSTSSKIEGNFKVFIGSRKAYTNIDNMLENAGVGCAGKLFLPDATAQVCLTDSELENGAALIEIGAGVTSLTIYQGQILRYYRSIPFGGNTITGDIKYECGFKEKLAENVKLAWGACVPDKLQSLSDKTIQINDNRTGTYELLPVKYLSEIIDARAREIIEAAVYCIHDSGFGKRLRCGIVITGGCAELANLSTLVKDISGFNVRTGYPRHDSICENDCSLSGSPSATASIGMLVKAAAAYPDTDCLEAAPKKAWNTVTGESAGNIAESAVASDADDGEYDGAFTEIVTPLNHDAGTVFDEISERDRKNAKEEIKRQERERRREERKERMGRRITWVKKNIEDVGGILEGLFDNIDND